MINPFVLMKYGPCNFQQVAKYINPKIIKTIATVACK